MQVFPYPAAASIIVNKGPLEKAQKNLQTASGQIEEVLGTRTRAIQRKLKEVDTLSDQDARAILPEIGNLDED